MFANFRRFSVADIQALSCHFVKLIDFVCARVCLRLDAERAQVRRLLRFWVARTSTRSTMRRHAPDAGGVALRMTVFCCEDTPWGVAKLFGEFWSSTSQWMFTTKNGTCTSTHTLASERHTQWSRTGTCGAGSVCARIQSDRLDRQLRT